jgi:hypothetical protein
MKGIDTTVSSITVAQMDAANMDFICRYILNAPGSSLNKQITKPEVARFSAGGKLIVSNFEWGERPPDTVAEGKAHARDFLNWAADFNAPDWSPCYFSLDANNAAGTYENYFHGVCDVITPERSAMYGNGACYRNLLAKKLISYAWQSKSSGYAGNHTTTGANLVQRLATANVGGHQVDVNDALTPLFGGWVLGMADPNGEDMAITDPDVEKIVAGVVAVFMDAANRTDAQGRALGNAVFALVRGADGFPNPDPATSSPGHAALAGLLASMNTAILAIPTTTVPAAPVDYVALAKAVNDDAAARLAE